MYIKILNVYFLFFIIYKVYLLLEFIFSMLFNFGYSNLENGYLVYNRFLII